MNKKWFIINVLFCVLITALFGSVMAQELRSSDFPQHIGWAKEYAATGYLYKIPHTLFAKLVVIIRSLLPANILVRISPLAKQVFDLKSFEISAWLLMVISYLATAFILVKRMTKDWNEEKSNIPSWVPYFAALVVLLVGPIFLFTFPERMYLGYFSPNPYHNPTYVLFRPFVLIVFLGVVDNLFSRWDWKKALLIALMIMCATLAKPSFTITILPSIGLLIVIFYISQFTKINWLFIIIPLGLTSLAVLGSQYFINYSGYWGDQIIIAPFKAVLTQIPNLPMVAIFGLLSILFPLLVSIFYWKTNSDRVSFRMVWINYLVALLFVYLVGEKINLDSNNFGWGVMIALFLLFTEAIIIFVKEIYRNGVVQSFKTWKVPVLSGVLFVHLICGIIYYINCLILETPLVR